MRSVNMHEAKSKLSELVAAVESGREEEVILMRGGKPVARLIASRSQPRIGVAKGEFVMPSEETWAALDEEIARMFNGEDEDLPDAAE